jgi:hypothetical protein
MSTAKSDLRDFSLFQFSLDVGPEGQPRQQAVLRGSSVTVEEAFESARRLAYEEVDRLRAASLKREGEPRPVELIDTEWGYDIRYGWLVVTRFWVHDGAARCSVAVE